MFGPRKERDAATTRRAKARHDECMEDPEYAAKWNAVTYQLRGLLPDLPDEVVFRGPVPPDTER